MLSVCVEDEHQVPKRSAVVLSLVHAFELQIINLAHGTEPRQGAKNLGAFVQTAVTEVSTDT